MNRLAESPTHALAKQRTRRLLDGALSTILSMLLVLDLGVANS